MVNSKVVYRLLVKIWTIRSLHKGFQILNGIRSRCEDLYLLMLIFIAATFAFSAVHHITASVLHGSVTFGVAASDLKWYDDMNKKMILSHWCLVCLVIKSICHYVFFFTAQTQLLCCRLYKATNVNWHHCVPKTGLEKLGLAVKGRLIGVT